MKRATGWAVTLILLTGLALSVGLYQRREAQIRGAARQHAAHQAEVAAAEIDRELRSVVPAHQKLVQTLASRDWTEEELSSHLCEVLAGSPILYGIGAAFLPHRFAADRALFAPYCREQDGVETAIRLEYDYTVPEKEWYHSPLRQRKDVWQEPHYGTASETWIVNITGPFAAPGETEPAGVVFSSLSLAKFRQLMAGLDLGERGYSFLVSAAGNIIVHPKESYLGTSLEKLASARGDGDLLQIAEAAGTGWSGSFDHFDELTGEHSWMFYEPVPTTGWTLVVVFLQDEMTADLTELHQTRPWLVVLAVVVMLWLTVRKLGLGGARSDHSLTFLAVSVTLILIFGSVALVGMGLDLGSEVEGGIVALTAHEGLQRFLSAYEESVTALGRESPLYLPTGLFVQSIGFSGSNDVRITGYLWQKYLPGQLDSVRPGFVFPEAVEHKVRHAFWRQEGEVEVIGWYFETTLRQGFDYSQYPFDSKQIWLRIWHRDFDKNVVLVPDLAAYGLTNPRSRPGLEEELVVAGWLVDRSFFGYRQHSYSTNFGLAGYVGQDGFPELHFNILTIRESGGALIVHFVPLMVVAAMLFALMASITSREEKNRWVGFSFSSMLGGVSSLFFVLILSHIQLREEVPENLVYLEWFYFLMYFAILATTVIGFRVASGGVSPLVAYRDNLVPKLLFWPLLAGCAFLVSLAFFT